jgi:thymidylate synthase (FAD)
MKQLLDHGYIRIVETYGIGDAKAPEAGIIEAARQSTQGSFRGWDKDRRLLAYLRRERHSGPFEFAGAIIEVRAPIFVARQWMRHRTESYNEMSARYAPLPDLDYLPTVERVMQGGGHLTRQAGAAPGTAPLTRQAAEAFVAAMAAHQQRTRAEYHKALDAGIPMEVARGLLTMNAYTQFRAAANLHNWLHFLSLRDKPDAQHETQLYAAALASLLLERFPRTMGLAGY